MLSWIQLQIRTIDVCAHYPDLLQMWKLDVTLRNSWTLKKKAQWTLGVATSAGVAAKSARYGKEVTAIALEPLGRIAQTLREPSWTMAQQACDKRLTDMAPSQRYRKLRLCLERALLWSMAEHLIAATGRT